MQKCARCGTEVSARSGRLVDGGGSATCGGDPSSPHIPESEEGENPW